jgi:hypothetical protein
MTDATPSRPSRATRARLVQLAVGGAFGLAAGLAAMTLRRTGLLDLSGLSWSDVGALLLGLLLGASGLFALLVSVSARASARVMDPGGRAVSRPADIVFYRRQGLVTLLAGVMMAIPAVAPLLATPLPPPLAMVLMLAVVALFLVQTALNLSVWTRADEMMRRTIAQAGAACFWTLQGALFLWAAAEKLGLAPALSTWDAMVVLMGVYLLVSSALAMRRGYA